MKTNIKRCTLLLLFIAVSAAAQRPAPVDSTVRRVLLLGATAHTGDGKVIEMSAIGIEGGKISFIMDARGFKPDPKAFDTIVYVHNKHVYPGFIALNTNLGLSDIELVRATNDYREAGSINPGARALIAYNTDSRVIPTVRDNGILLAQIVPEGGLMSGTSSVVQLDAWNWEDAAVKADEGLWINWPSMRIYKGYGADPEDEQRERNEKNLKALYKQFDDARAYAAGSNAVFNSHLEAMKATLRSEKRVYIRCNYAREIIEAVRFAEQYRLKAAIVGGADAWMLTDMLREKNIPVIIVRTHALPYRDDDAVDLMYRLPALLYKAGVQVAIADQGFWQQRNLGFQAGSAAGYGLSKEEALMTITSTPAKILGIDDHCGTLTEGKDATLFISAGDALDMTGNHVEMAFIQGRPIPLESYQKELYRRYMKKYGLTE